jgi:excisionase family DNA binding protein
MNAQHASDTTSAAPITEVAEACGVSSYTLHRLCQSGRVQREAGGRGWLVRRQDVERYLEARLSDVKPEINVVLQGPAPRGYHESGAGWRFQTLRPEGTPIAVNIWFSEQLIKMLQRDHLDPGETAQRAAPYCVVDTLLVADELSDGVELLYGSPDRAFVLHAATTGDNEAARFTSR